MKIENKAGSGVYASDIADANGNVVFYSLHCYIYFIC